MTRFVNLPHATSADQFEIGITANAGHNLGGQMRYFLDLCIQPLRIGEIELDAEYLFIDNISSNFERWVDQTKDSQSCNHNANRRRILIACDRAKQRLQTDENTSEHKCQDNGK